MNRMSEIYRQLKERRVIRAGVLYLAGFWLLLQVVDLLAESGLVSDLLMRWLILAGVVILPAVLVLSWFFEHPWHERHGLSLLGDFALLAAVTLATALLAWQQWQSGFSRPVIAVLPFEPTDTRPETRALAHHLASRLRLLLADAAGVSVIDNESAWHDSLRTLPLPEKAAALGADYLVTGTLNQTRLNLRVNLQLFDADGELLFSERLRDRVIDQYHLQSAMLDGLWPALGIAAAERVRAGEVLAACEYPADRDLIIELAQAGRFLDRVSSEDVGELRQWIERLDRLTARTPAAGLAYVLRARFRLEQLPRSRRTRQPVLLRMAQADLEQARFLCPAWPEVERLALLHTRRLESPETDLAAVFERHSNDPRILQRLAQISEVRDDPDSASAYRDLACRLNPLRADSICP